MLSSAVVAVVVAACGGEPEKNCISTTGEEVYCNDCCAVCRDGKACGAACIPRSSTCHLTGGCACDHK